MKKGLIISFIVIVLVFSIAFFILNDKQEASDITNNVCHKDFSNCQK